MPESTPLISTFTEDVPAVTILADNNAVICEAPYAGTVSAVEYIAIAAVTGAASPASRTLSLINKGQAGAGTTAVATLALVSAVNLVAFDAKTITLSSTAADLVVAAGDVLVWNSLHVGGTGLVDPGGTVVVQITRS